MSPSDRLMRPSYLYIYESLIENVCSNYILWIEKVFFKYPCFLHNELFAISFIVATDLLILSLDLVKNRVGVMGQDMRKTFIGTILVGLIEKSPDVKVLKALTKMVEDWVKSKSTIAVNQSPSIREKSILLVKMMQFIEKRFPNDLDLNAQFLELVHYVYK